MSPKKDKVHEAPPAPPRWRSYAVWVALALIILAAALVRLRVADLPLERDEGEYAYAGQLLLDGMPPYSLAYNMKFPGMYVAYAAMMAVFGQTAAGIHIGLTLVCAATAVLVFLLSRRLIDPTAGLVAAAGYALLALSPNLLALAGHATHFVMLAALGGLLLLLRAIESGRRLTFFLSGLCLGVAILMKQPGAMFLVFAGLYLVWVELMAAPRQWKRLAVRLGLLVAGALAPLVLTGLLLWWAGVFGRFWFWTITYAAQYGSVMSASDGLMQLVYWLPDRVGSAWGLWLLAGLGLVVMAWDPKKRWEQLYHANVMLYLLLAVTAWYCGREFGQVRSILDADTAYAAPQRLHYEIAVALLVAQVVAAGILGLVAAALDRRRATAAVFGFGFLVSAIVATSAGLYFREHYFILMVPVVALLAGAAVSITWRLLAEARLPAAVVLIPVGVFAAFGVYALHQQRQALLVDSPNELSRAMYSLNPFPESLPVAECLRAHTNPEDRIAVLGSEPQLFFYAHRRSATGYIYTYGLMESQPYAHTMQEEMIKQITEAHPAYVVAADIWTSWLPQPKSDKTVLKWMEPYLQAHYELVGLVEIPGDTPTEYSWDEKLHERLLQLRERPPAVFKLRIYRAKPQPAAPAAPAGT